MKQENEEGLLRRSSGINETLPNKISDRTQETLDEDEIIRIQTEKEPVPEQ